MSEKPKKCPRCEDTEIWKDGFTVRSGKGKVQRFKCVKCGYSWVPQD